MFAMRSGTGGRSAPTSLRAAAASLFIVGAALLAGAPASAAIPSVFDGEVSCSGQPNGSFDVVSTQSGYGGFTRARTFVA
jgi:hypothetical protein